MNNFSPPNKHAAVHPGKKDGVDGEVQKGNDFARSSFKSAKCSEANQVALLGAKGGSAPPAGNLIAAAAKTTKATPKKRKFRHVWSHPEDAALLKLVEKHDFKEDHNNHWAQIAVKLKSGRNGKQCRDRYQNHLRPDIKKGGWTHEEELLIREMHESFGTKWSCMSKLMKHRTDNDIKNKWYSMMRKEKKTQEEQQRKVRQSCESISNKNAATKKSEKALGEQQKFFEPMDETLDHNLASDGIAQLVAADTLFPCSTNLDLAPGALHWTTGAPSANRPSIEADSWVASFGQNLPVYYDPRLTANLVSRPGTENAHADCAMQDIGSGNEGRDITLASAQSHPYPADASILYISDDTMPPLYIMPHSNADAQVLAGNNDLYLEGHGVHANSANNCHITEPKYFWGGCFNSGNSPMPIVQRSQSGNPSLNGTGCSGNSMSDTLKGDTIKKEYYMGEPDPTHSNGKLAMKSNVPQLCSSTSQRSIKSDESMAMPNACSSTPGAKADNYSDV